MQRLVSEVTFPSFEGEEAFFDENSFSNDEDFADDKKTSCSLTIVSAFCFSSLIFASRTSKWQLPPWKIIICLNLIFIFSSTHSFSFHQFFEISNGRNLVNTFLESIVCLFTAGAQVRSHLQQNLFGAKLVLVGFYWVSLSKL